jgi:hypothetical protein
LYLVWKALLFVLCSFVGSLGISFGRCNFYCICLFVDVVSLNSVLCSEFLMLFLFVCPWIILWFFLFLFPLYVQVAPFVFQCCRPVPVISFYGAGCFMILFILSCDTVTTDRVLNGNWIYWTLTDHNYK